jgi:hypothetical protein
MSEAFCRHVSNLDAGYELANTSVHSLPNTTVCLVGTGFQVADCNLTPSSPFKMALGKKEARVIIIRDKTFNASRI